MLLTDITHARHFNIATLLSPEAEGELIDHINKTLASLSAATLAAPKVELKGELEALVTELSDPLPSPGSVSPMTVYSLATPSPRPETPLISTAKRIEAQLKHILQAFRDGNKREAIAELIQTEQMQSTIPEEREIMELQIKALLSTDPETTEMLS